MTKKELMAKSTSGDGAKNAFAIFFGWIYSLIFLLFLESVYKITSYIRKYFGKRSDL